VIRYPDRSQQPVRDFIGDELLAGGGGTTWLDVWVLQRDDGFRQKVIRDEALMNLS